MIEEPEGDRELSEKHVWHIFPGREHVHYNLPHAGTKFSIVAYSQRLKHGRPKRSRGGAVEEDVC